MAAKTIYLIIETAGRTMLDIRDLAVVRKHHSTISHVRSTMRAPNETCMHIECAIRAKSSERRSVQVFHWLMV